MRHNFPPTSALQEEFSALAANGHHKFTLALKVHKTWALLVPLLYDSVALQQVHVRVVSIVMSIVMSSLSPIKDLSSER